MIINSGIILDGGMKGEYRETVATLLFDRMKIPCGGSESRNDGTVHVGCS